MAKTKKTVIDLDTIELSHDVIPAEEVAKIKEAKFSGGRRPSILALKMGDLMLKKPLEGHFIKVEGMTDERKESIGSTLRKELMKVLKEKGKSKEYRLRFVDQGTRLAFFYDAKKPKVEEKASSKKGKAA